MRPSPTAFDGVLLLARSSPQLIAVEGAAGLGKSTLLGRLAGEADPAMRVIARRADRWEHDTPLSLLAAAITPLLPVGTAADGRSPSPNVADHADASVSFMSSTLTAARSRLVDDLRAAAEHGPVALILDDVHLAPPEDLALCVELRRSFDGPLLIAVAGRVLPASVFAAADIAIALEPLKPLDALAVATDRLGARPGPLLTRRINAALGVPAAIVELVDAARIDDVLVEIGDRTLDLRNDELPSSLTARVLRRIVRLGDVVRRLATAAAIVDPPLDPGVLAEVADVGGKEGSDAIERLRAAGLFRVEADVLSWSHELLREAVLSSTDRAARSGMHVRAGDSLARRGSAPEIVLSHLEAAGVADKTLHVWHTRVAREAAPVRQVRSLRWLLEYEAQADIASATDVGLRSIDESPMSDQPVSDQPVSPFVREELLLRLCSAGFDAVDLDTVRAAALEQVDRRPDDGLAWEYLVSIAIAQNRMDDVATLAERGVALVDDPLTKARLAAAGALGALSTMRGIRFSDLNEAVAVAESCDDAATRAAVFTVMSRLAAHDFDAEGAVVASEKATTGTSRRLASLNPASPTGTNLSEVAAGLAIEAIRFQPHQFASIARFEDDDLNGALAWIAVGRAHAAALGLTWPEAILLSQAASVLWPAGRRDEAVAAALDARREGLATRVTPALLLALAVLAEDALDNGDLDSARRWLDEGDEVVAAGGQFGVHVLALARARLLAESGRPEEALGVLELFWMILVENSIGPALVEMAGPVVIAAYISRPDLVERVVDDLSTRLRGREDGAPRLALAVAAWCCAVRDHDVDAARAALLAVPQVWTRRLGTLVSGTLAVFGPDAINGLDVGSGEPGAGVGEAASVQVALTSTEALVASALADGCSNREIADRCFMKVRTVETHVLRISRKFGVHSRTQAIAMLRNRSS